MTCDCDRLNTSMFIKQYRYPASFIVLFSGPKIGLNQQQHVINPVDCGRCIAVPGELGVHRNFERRYRCIYTPVDHGEMSIKVRHELPTCHGG